MSSIVGLTLKVVESEKYPDERLDSGFSRLVVMDEPIKS
jgi:hypothetical protein